MSFNDPIIGGGGNMVVAQIKSPNYSAGEAGWIIQKDGSAQFNDLSVTGGSIIIDSSTSGVFIYATGP